MIKYNLNNINDWNFGEDNIIKVYRNNAVCYYKISGTPPSPTAQTPCFAVVDNISQYSDTEFEDVFNKADEKWYKLNNLNQYEEYGVYGSGRTITYYEGKLTIDTETPPSRLPQGYTEVEYIENTSTAYINTEVLLYDSTTNSYNIQCKCYFQPYGNDFEYLFGTEGTSSPYVGVNLRYYQRNIQYNSSPDNVLWTHIDNGDGTSGITASCSSTTATNGNNPLTLFCGLWSTGPWRNGRGKIYSFKVTKNDTLVRDLVPCKRDSDDKYGMFDIVNDVFYVSPNNVDFSGGEPVAKQTTYEYIYSGGSWINVGEVSGSTATLPDVPFTVNYNAKNYNSSTKTLLKTEGQLANVDAVITAGTPTVHDGYLTIATNTRATISGYQTYFNRTNSTPNLTIISKQMTNNNSDVHLFANRDSNYNWMYRATASQLKFHGSSQKNGTNVTTQPVIESVRVDSGRTLKFNNYTDNTTTSVTSFNYGSTNSTATALFAGYANSTGEWFAGDFYWVYMCQSTLTDEQVQQVIAYNEGGGGQTEYPLEYVVREDPPDNVTFTSMTEAEDYECPWVGMKATIDGSGYTFSGDSQSGYEWVYIPSRLPDGYTEVEYVENTSTAYIDTGAYLNTSNFEIGYTIGNKQQLFGYCHQGCGSCTWLGVEQSALMFWGNNNNSANISSYLTSSENTITFTQSGATVNGTSISKTLSIGSDNISNVSLLIFARYDFKNNVVEHRTDSYMQLKSFYLKNNGTLVRDFVPAKRDSDDKYGMYDIVNDVFYVSPNNVDFSGGEPV